MNILEIEVPDMNDSFVKVTLSGVNYQLRFTWNDTAGFWSVGIFDDLRNPIVQGLKIVPNFPLNLQYAYNNSPDGVLCAYTKLEKIGRQDFNSREAIFAFIPIQ